MMGISHETLVGFAKSFGLFYLVALSVGICIYAFWPRNRDQFDRAKRSILDDEDGPLRLEDLHPGDLHPGDLRPEDRP